jgi:transposase
VIVKQSHKRCAGLDVHKESVVACARVAKGRSAKAELKAFQTTTIGLLALADWLESRGCTHVVMEATGVYWKPVWHVLEGRFELILANAAHVKNVPGRKTDVKDAQWLADLVAHGLVRSSFVPPAPIQAVRDLTRTRKQMTREQGRHVQRIHKVLEDANIKVTSVLTDVMGVTGRRILDAILEGVADPATLAEFRNPRCKHSEQEFVDALTGVVTAHHRFLLRMHLAQVDGIQACITELEEELGRHLEPFREAEALLVTMPGVEETTARVLIAEIGVDMSRFPTVEHLRSWACVCPRSDESAGKRRSTRTRKGAPWLKATLVQAAWAAVRTKDSYFRAQYARLKARRGPKKAIMAVASSMLTSMYYMLLRNEPYRDLGYKHFDQLSAKSLVRRLTNRIEALGYSVTLTPLTDAS